jgi:ribosomal protein S18 acetylase RimI-like enzyme
MRWIDERAVSEVNEGATVVVEALSPLQLDQVRELIRAFVDWHRGRHVDDLRLIDDYFDPEAFEAELAGLPGKYARPTGRLLLALHAGEPAGCVALRGLDSDASEMKRMFVSPRFQGIGVGRALADAVIADARAQGYKTMWLDTSIRQTEAQGLYRSLGFEIVSPYYDLPPALADWLVFMRKDLGDSHRGLERQKL